MIKLTTFRHQGVCEIGCAESRYIFEYMSSSTVLRPAGFYGWVHSWIYICDRRPSVNLHALAKASQLVLWYFRRKGYGFYTVCCVCGRSCALQCCNDSLHFCNKVNSTMLSPMLTAEGYRLRNRDDVSVANPLKLPNGHFSFTKFYHHYHCVLDLFF